MGFYLLCNHTRPHTLINLVLVNLVLINVVNLVHVRSLQLLVRFQRNLAVVECYRVGNFFHVYLSHMMSAIKVLLVLR